MYKYNNILILIESPGLFLWANSWKFKIENTIIINLISFLGKNALTVYLLHSTCWLTIFRKIPVKKLLRMRKFNLAIVLLPIYVLIIHIACSMISVIYSKTIQKNINKICARKELSNS
ncbi:MAG: DUF418 domain-containing protein [Bacilli bacterium]|nr:DUF418 domain-containing protein [Bacilli bacterium]